MDGLELGLELSWVYDHHFFLVHRKNNVDIEVGDFRYLNLELEPFSGAFFGYELMETFDFDGPKRDGIKKRVYFFKKVTS